MTTAHRPTWKAAVGKANEGGWTAGGAISTRSAAQNAPAQLTLKTRAEPIDKKKALKESLLALQKAEEKANTLVPKRRPVDPKLEQRAQQRLLKQTAEVDLQKIKAKYNDSDVDDDDDEKGEDDDDGGGGDSDDSSDLDNDSSSDEDDSDDDDDDDEEALAAELAKIRAEREEVRRQEEEKAQAAEEAEQEESALLGNPLLAVGGGATASNDAKRRRWNEDVVFRNQAQHEPKPKKRFINDTVRNDFHKRFLNKFIR
mmetsp:Transcript_13302/g.29245  ORF Transcript_13302/g.29245 Transcript_13302/m.29245 type:complete len:257 (-) Transcript_13302:2409-3179(-)